MAAWRLLTIHLEELLVVDDRAESILLDAPRLRVDAVIADVDSVPTPERLRTAAASLGATAHLSTVTAGGAADRHDPAALALSLRDALQLHGLHDRV